VKEVKASEGKVKVVRKKYLKILEHPLPFPKVIYASKLPFLKVNFGFKLPFPKVIS
jgi:hypothetical protein